MSIYKVKIVYFETFILNRASINGPSQTWKTIIINNIETNEPCFDRLWKRVGYNGVIYCVALKHDLCSVLLDCVPVDTIITA